MTQEEMIEVFEEKITELESFFRVVHNPEEKYGHSMRLCEAMKLACDIARNGAAEKQACFRLGQMDMRESVVACLREESRACGGAVRATLIASADYVEKMEVI